MYVQLFLVHNYTKIFMCMSYLILFYYLYRNLVTKKKKKI